MEGVPRIEVNQVKLMKAFRIKYGEVERGKGGREGCGAREERGERWERERERERERGRGRESVARIQMEKERNKERNRCSDRKKEDTQ